MTADHLAALIVVIDFDGVPLDEWNEWYDTEHVPERAALPGFLTASRWLAADGSTSSLGCYDLDSIEALQTPQYLALRGDNASPWTRRIHRLRNAVERPSHRYQCVQVSPGAMVAPRDAQFLHLIRTRVDADAEDGYEAAAEQALAQLEGLPGVLCVRRFRALNHDARLHKYLQLAHLDVATTKVLASLDASALTQAGVRSEARLFATPTRGHR